MGPAVDPTSIEIGRASLQEPADQQAIIALLDHYALHPMGQSAALAEDIRARLIDGLAKHPTTVVFLARAGDVSVGMASCFVGFSTFKARPLINIHDLIVHEDYRGQGLGGALIDAVVHFAQAQDYCGVTLEVRGDNPARQLYAKKGFQGLADSTPEQTMYFGKIDLTQG